MPVYTHYTPIMMCWALTRSHSEKKSMWSFSLVFCDCGFHSVCPLKDKDKSGWEWEQTKEKHSPCPWGASSLSRKAVSDECETNNLTIIQGILYN